jgi:hypothetical protein
VSASDHLGQQFYLRAGAPPASGRSRSNATGKEERGVSVYESDDHGFPKTPDEGEWASEDKHARLRDTGTPWFVVQGKKVGTGEDGEPLLHSPVVVGRWNPALRVVHRGQR